MLSVSLNRHPFPTLTLVSAVLAVETIAQEPPLIREYAMRSCGFAAESLHALVRAHIEEMRLDGSIERPGSSKDCARHVRD
jgi:hypothetical protein